MEERKAKMLALLCSFAGLGLLYLSSSLFDQLTPSAKIIDLSLDDAGIGAKLCGNITSIKTSNLHMFIQLDDGTGTMSIVVFNTTAARINQTAPTYSLAKGDGICASGQLEEYPPGSGQLELVAKSVMV